MKKIISLLAALAVLGWVAGPTALDAAVPVQCTTACGFWGSSFASAYLDTPNGGDNDFFTAKERAGVLIVVDTSGSMKALPELPPTFSTTGSFCAPPDPNSTNAFLAALGRRGYAPSPVNPTPVFDPDAAAAGEPTFNQSDFFTVSLGFSGGWDWTNTWTTPKPSAAAACSTAPSALVGQCMSCMNATGYFRAPGYMAFSADLANFYPPKYAIARKVVRDLVKQNSNLRIGIAGFASPSCSEPVSLTLDPADGGRLISKLLPECDAGPAGVNLARTTLLSAIDTQLTFASFDGCTPLGETLLNAGQLFAESDTVYNTAFTSNWTRPAFTSTGPAAIDRSVCYACQFNAIVLLSDGNPNKDGNIPPVLRALKDGDTLGGHTLNCSVLSTAGTPSPCESESLHKVAWWLRNNDLQPGPGMPGIQNVSTYTVGFGLDSPLLKEAAIQGDGEYYVADDAVTLRRALSSALGSISSRAASFAAANFSGMQSESGQAILVPRMNPMPGAFWPGHLFRFDFVAEFVNEMDLNNNGGQQDLFVVDSGCGTVDWDNITPATVAGLSNCRPIEVKQTAPDQGVFFRKTGWDQSDGLSTTRAVPFWDAGEVLVSTSCPKDDGSDPCATGHRSPDESSSNPRRIFTVVDADCGGNINAADPMVPFTEANWDKLFYYLNLHAQNFCGDLAEDNGFPRAQYECIAPTDPGCEPCAKAVIRYVRGCEVVPDASGKCVPRAWVLGDIFHSVPIIVEPPTHPELLSHPILRSDQSMVTLQNPFDPFTSAMYGTPSKTAYATYQASFADRDRFTLVGANDGMLHAFRVGRFQSRVGHRVTYDKGDGAELWAFIPPDLLPKLKLMLERQGRHHYFMDGNAWVRNVWKDGWRGGAGLDVPADFVRQKEEYLTVAVVGERRGGNHYFALDVTGGDDENYVPKLLWSFPAPGGMEALRSGQSWNDNAPLPPPIGPIRLKKAGSPANAPSSGTPFEERWIVALSAGYDSMVVLKGRGWRFLDVVSGEVLWDYTRDPAVTTGPNAALTYSFAATPSMTNWGPLPTTNFDSPYFDTMVVGDLGGQLWVANFYDPDPLKWTAARLFQQKEARVSLAMATPFYQQTLLQPMPETGLLRAYIGSGDRENLRDPGGGTCSVDNPLICMRMGCEVKGEFKLEVGGKETEISWTYDPATGQITWGLENEIDGAGNACTKFEAEKEFEIENCPGSTGGEFEVEAEAECKVPDLGGPYFCKAKYEIENDMAIPCTTSTATWPKGRFYSIRVFGGATLTPATLAATPAAFDAARLQEGMTLASDIVQVPAQLATADSPGWYYEYALSGADASISPTPDPLAERTATPAVTLASCVSWSSLRAPPQTACVSGFTQTHCGVGDDQTAFMYLRNYVTGGTNCTYFDPPPPGWESDVGRRNIGREPKPPPPPRAVIQVSKSGKVSGNIATADNPAGMPVGQEDSLLGDYGEVEVPLSTHEVRHAKKP